MKGPLSKETLLLTNYKQANILNCWSSSGLAPNDPIIITQVKGMVSCGGHLLPIFEKETGGIFGANLNGHEWKSINPKIGTPSRFRVRSLHLRSHKGSCQSSNGLEALGLVLRSQEMVVEGDCRAWIHYYSNLFYSGYVAAVQWWQVSRKACLSKITVQGGNGAASTAPAARGCSARKAGLTQQIRFGVREAFLIEHLLQVVKVL